MMENDDIFETENNESEENTTENSDIETNEEDVEVIEPDVRETQTDEIQADDKQIYDAEVNETDLHEEAAQEEVETNVSEAQTDETDTTDAPIYEAEVHEEKVHERHWGYSGINETKKEYKEAEPEKGDGGKKTKNTSKVLWLLVCALVGFVSGIGGTLITMQLSSRNTNTNGDVVYQSVIQTSANGEEVSEMLTEDVVANVKNSVVEITTSVTKTTVFLEQYVTSGAGSGVIFSKEGLIVTNHHVIEGADEIKVRLANGDEYEATLIASDAQTDLAVLRIDANDLQPVILGNSADLKVGERVLAIGNPLGSLGGTVTEGIISATDRDITIDGQSMTLLQTSAAINPGNSGGGLFNSRGELIGIVNAKSSGSDIEGLGFAIPIDIAKSVVTDLVEKGKVSGRLTLGIKYYEISSITQAMQHGVNILGLLVSEVVPNSNAANAGIKVNDIIVEVDGQQVTTSDDLKSILYSHKVGDTMRLTVVRDKQYVELSTVLAE